MAEYVIIDPDAAAVTAMTDKAAKYRYWRTILKAIEDHYAPQIQALNNSIADLNLEKAVKITEVNAKIQALEIGE